MKEEMKEELREVRQEKDEEIRKLGKQLHEARQMKRVRIKNYGLNDLEGLYQEAYTMYASYSTHFKSLVKSDSPLLGLYAKWQRPDW